MCTFVLQGSYSLLNIKDVSGLSRLRPSTVWDLDQHHPKVWDHTEKYYRLNLETILIQKVWTVSNHTVHRTLKHISCIHSTTGPTQSSSTIRRSTRRARLPTTSGSVHATFTINPNMKILEDMFFSTTRVYLCPSSKTFSSTKDSKTCGNLRPLDSWPHYIHLTALLTVHILIFFLHSASTN